MPGAVAPKKRREEDSREDAILSFLDAAAASASLIEELGGIVGGIHVLVELAALPGRAAISHYNVFALLTL